jgi:hypothetical protein
MKRTTHYGVCPKCGGTGKGFNDRMTAPDLSCTHCSGSGRVVTSIVEDDGTWPSLLRQDPHPRKGPDKIRRS